MSGIKLAITLGAACGLLAGVLGSPANAKNSQADYLNQLAVQQYLANQQQAAVLQQQQLLEQQQKAAYAAQMDAQNKAALAAGQWNQWHYDPHHPDWNRLWHRGDPHYPDWHGDPHRADWRGDPHHEDWDHVDPQHVDWDRDHHRDHNKHGWQHW